MIGAFHLFAGPAGEILFEDIICSLPFLVREGANWSWEAIPPVLSLDVLLLPEERYLVRYRLAPSDITSSVAFTHLSAPMVEFSKEDLEQTSGLVSEYSEAV